MTHFVTKSLRERKSSRNPQIAPVTVKLRAGSKGYPVVQNKSQGVGMQDELFTTKSAAGYMKCSVPYVRRLKRDGGGPRYIQRGKFVRYRKSDLDAFIEANVHSGHNCGAAILAHSGHGVAKEAGKTQGERMNQAACSARRKN